MKKLIIFIGLLFVVSCSGEVTEEVVEHYNKCKKVGLKTSISFGVSETAYNFKCLGDK